MNETYDNLIGLINQIKVKNDFDELEIEMKVNTVFADIQELSQFEYTQAAAQGLKPEIKFVITEALEYNGEKLIEYNSKYYKVIRTKKTKDGRGLMIYCESTINPWEVDSNGNAEIGNKT